MFFSINSGENSLELKHNPDYPKAKQQFLDIAYDVIREATYFNNMNNSRIEMNLTQNGNECKLLVYNVYSPTELQSLVDFAGRHRHLHTREQRSIFDIISDKAE